MFRIHPILFFLITLALFSGAAYVGLWFRNWKSQHIETEDLSVKTLLGASLGLFGVLLGFTFSMANSRFEERRQLEIAEATDLQILWFRTTFLPEPDRIAERVFLRQYIPLRIRFFDAGPGGAGYEEALSEGTALQARMWQVANAGTADPRGTGLIQFHAALTDSIQAAERRTAASENRLPALSWAILLMLGMMACVLLGVDLKARSIILRGMLQVALASALALTYDIDTPRVGFVQVGQGSMLRTQQLINAAPN